jgi:hypothetical protein
MRPQLPVFAAQLLVPQIIVGRLLCQFYVWHARMLSSVHDDLAYGLCYCMYYRRWMPAFCRIGNSTVSWTPQPLYFAGRHRHVLLLTALFPGIIHVDFFCQPCTMFPSPTRVIGARNDGLTAVFYCLLVS